MLNFIKKLFGVKPTNNSVNSQEEINDPVTTALVASTYINSNKPAGGEVKKSQASTKKKPARSTPNKAKTTAQPANNTNQSAATVNKSKPKAKRKK